MWLEDRYELPKLGPTEGNGVILGLRQREPGGAVQLQQDVRPLGGRERHALQQLPNVPAHGALGVVDEEGGLVVRTSTTTAYNSSSANS